MRFDDYLCIRVYHDGYQCFEGDRLLFDVVRDPHEQHDLAAERPDLVDRAMNLLAQWHHEMALTSQRDIDPMMTVLREGGPFHTRGMLPGYLARLRATGRAHHAELLAARHPDEAGAG